MEEHLAIQAGDVILEARFIPGTIPAGAVITHPHPLYGGSMDNNVVWTAGRALGDRGWATLRFNFRGVGASTGRYGEGLAEVADLTAAMAFLKSRVAGPCYVAGYSFGAAVAARALLEGLEAAGAVLIAPPIAFMDLAFLPETPGLHLIIAGDRDDLCPLGDLEAFLRGRQPPVDLRVVSGADHFFGGREKELYQILKGYPFPSGPA
jgi:hypothetical protein